MKRASLASNQRKNQDEFSLDAERAEHLLVFFSLMFGLIVAEFLDGWSNALRDLEEMGIFSLRPMLWSLCGFVLITQSWWALWFSRKYVCANFIHFLVFLAIPACFYMMATLFFPPEDSPRSYAEHFEIKKWMIFTSAAISLFLLGFREIVIQREYVLGRNAIRVTGIVVLLGIVFLEKVLRVTWAIYAEWSALISCSVLLAVFIGVYRFRGVPS